MVDKQMEKVRQEQEETARGRDVWMEGRKDRDEDMRSNRRMDGKKETEKDWLKVAQ